MLTKQWAGYAPLVYITKWGAYPECLQSVFGIDSAASVLPATRALLQKDTGGFST